MASMMRWRSPAKINLHLRVGGPGPDGFHPLMSWMVTVGLFDKLSFEFEGWLDRSSVRLTSDDSAVPMDGSNLICRAIDIWRKNRAADAKKDPQRSNRGKLFRQHRLVGGHGWISVSLEKRIPSGGGLGGGSSNAATTLCVLESHFAKAGFPKLSHDELSKFGAELGSDVPFFFDAPSALSSGRGEKIVRVSSPRPRAVLLFFPPFGVSTPAAYRVLDELRPHPPKDVLDPIDVEEWKMLSAAALLPRLRNDLEIAAFHLQPRLGVLREMLERKLERPVRMSGSGSTLFTLYETEVEAHEARQKLGQPSEMMIDKTIVKSEFCSLGQAKIEEIVD